MKMLFEEPDLQVITFAVEDILTTSDGGDIGPVGGDNMGDWA